MITLRPKIPTLGTGQLYLVNKHRVKMLDDAARRHIIIAFIGLLVCASIIFYNCFYA